MVRSQVDLGTWQEIGGDPCGELLGSGAGALKPTVWTRNHVNLVNEVDQTNV